MALQSEMALDKLNWQILRELQGDSRLSYNELGRRVGLSAPAAAERVRKLEDAGVIGGYGVRIELAKVGLPLTAFVHLRCSLGRCLLKTARVDDFPEVREVHKLSGRHCTLLKLAAASMGHLEEVIDRLGRHGELETAVVLSSPLPHRDVDWEHGPQDSGVHIERRWDRM